MNPLQLPLIFQAVFCEPLALETGHFYSLAAFLLPRMAGQASVADLSRISDLSAAVEDKSHKFGHQRSGMAAPRAKSDGSVDTRYYNTLDGRSDVAVIPWNGVMAKGAGWLQEACMGMVSHERLTHALNQAIAEPAVQTIVLDIGSPGGTVVGTPELAALVQFAGTQKSTVAFVDNMMASAAVYAGIQANETYLTPSARIGSIGTILGVLDNSVQMQMQGLKMEVFSEGKHKAIGMPGRSLTEEDKTYLQSIAKEANTEFQAAVKQARPDVSPEALTGAKMYVGKQAVRAGLADGIVSSWEEFISLL
jgi:signal peptide peptidase SppA